MPYIKNTQSNTSVNIYYEDYGSGQPVVLIHGWPLSHKSWEKQVPALIEAGYRVISYDRRGFGDSSAPWNGYDYSTLAGDLHQLISDLDLKDAVIVGFSMGGGEVVRYLTEYGNDRVAKAALISSIIPLVAQKDDNPDGVPADVLSEIMMNLKNDRVKFLSGFHQNFYNFQDNQDLVSEQQLHYDWSIASHASPRATVKTAEAWGGTDFRSELKNVTVPTLIVHGDADEIVPMATAGDQAAQGIPDNQYEVIKGGPHGLNVTHSDILNELLISFLKK